MLDVEPIYFLACSLAMARKASFVLGRRDILRQSIEVELGNRHDLLQIRVKIVNTGSLILKVVDARAMRFQRQQDSMPWR